MVRLRRVKHDFSMGQHRVYINEALTEANRKLLAMARATKRAADGFRFVSVRNGISLAKASGRSRPFLISCEMVIEKIK